MTANKPYALQDRIDGPQFLIVTMKGVNLTQTRTIALATVSKAYEIPDATSPIAFSGQSNSDAPTNFQYGRKCQRSKSVAVSGLACAAR
jgi:hypothetical protein